MSKLNLKKIKWKHYIGYIVVLAVLLYYGISSVTSGLPSSTLYMLEKLGIGVNLALSLSLVVGFLGELSLGHAGFMCVGAYLGGKLAVVLAPSLGNGPLLLILCLFFGGLVSAAFGFIIGLPALRLKGDYLAIVTLAFGEIVKSVFLNSSSESFGGPLGLATPRFDKTELFIYAFGLILLTIMVIQNMMRSKHGRAITAVRDSEIAAKACGVNVTRYKLIVFAVSAFFAGVAGVLYSFSNYQVQSTKFGYNYSIEILVMVVLGGGHINGTMFSAALITFLNAKLATILTGDLAVLQNLVYAMILICLVIYNNAPALKTLREKIAFRKVIGRIFRPKHDPSNIRDDENRWNRIPTKIQMDEVLSLQLTIEQEGPDRPGKEG